MSKVVRSEDEWRRLLTPEQYAVLRGKGTERAFSGKYHDSHAKGVYACAACGQELFASDTKFESGSGWPSFYQAIERDRVATEVDSSHGMTRVEALCSQCDSHLGHVFPDGPQPTGLRFCMNSASLALKPQPDKTSGKK